MTIPSRDNQAVRLFIRDGNSHEVEMLDHSVTASDLRQMGFIVREVHEPGLTRVGAAGVSNSVVVRSKL